MGGAAPCSPLARALCLCRYLAYFSCSAPNSRHSVGVAVAGEDPFGSYVDPLGVPLIFHNEVQPAASTDTECGHHVQDSIAGPIDQHYFKDPLSGKDYLIWKTDELVLPFNPSVVYIQELAESGTAFAEGSVKTKILQTDRLMFQLLRNYSAMTDP